MEINSNNSSGRQLSLSTPIYHYFEQTGKLTFKRKIALEGKYQSERCWAAEVTAKCPCCCPIFSPSTQLGHDSPGWHRSTPSPACPIQGIQPAPISTQSIQPAAIRTQGTQLSPIRSEESSQLHQWAGRD